MDSWNQNQSVKNFRFQKGNRGKETEEKREAGEEDIQTFSSTRLTPASARALLPAAPKFPAQRLNFTRARHRRPPSSPPRRLEHLGAAESPSRST